MDTVYLTFLRRWWWLLAIGIVVSLVATYHAISERPPFYSATATIQVGRTFQEKSPDQNQIAITDRLANAYAELAKRDSILSATIQTLGVPFSPADLRARLLVTPVPGTALVDLLIVDSDPVRAAAIANEIARQIILQTPAAGQDDSDQDFIQAQLTDLSTKIAAGQERIIQIQDELAVLTSAADIYDARQRLEAIQTQVDSCQESYARLLASVQPSDTNTVSIVSPASPPTVPNPMSTRLYYALALFVGAGLSTVLALGLEILSPTVRGARDVQSIVPEVQSTVIPRYRVPSGPIPAVLTMPGSPPAVAYRILRNTLETFGVGTPGKTIGIASSRVGEGKTTTAINLAMAIANAGHRVTLVDANVRNPELAERFRRPGAPGFSDLLRGTSSVNQVLQDIGHPNLRLVTAGSIPPNYVDLLSIPASGVVVRALASTADLVLFDLPAVLEERDVLLLTKHVDGVLFMAEAGRVRRDELREAVDLVRRTGAQIAVVALNKVRQPVWARGNLPWSYEARARERAARRRAAIADEAPPTIPVP